MQKSDPYTIESLLGSLSSPTCEYQLATRELCGHTASWMLALSCGDTRYECDAHQAQIEAWITKDASPLQCFEHPDYAEIQHHWVQI